MRFEYREIPADMKAQCDEYRAKLVEAAAEGNEELLHKYLEDEQLSTEEIKQGPARARDPQRDLHRHLRLRLQEQGRAGRARRGHRLHAVADRSAGRQGPDRGQRGDEITRPPTDEAPFSALAFKILNDPFVGNLTFFRVYSGHAVVGRPGVRAEPLAQGAHRPPAADARERPRGDQGSPRRRHRRGRGPQGRDDRRHAVRPGRRHRAREDGIPGPGDLGRRRAEDQGRPGKDGHRAAAPGARKTRRSACRPTRSRARRSSPAWASCTSRSSSTA